MKKLVLIIVSILLAAGLMGCVDQTAQPVVLTLDENTAYFTSEKTLLPISGSTLTEDEDIYEQATITMTADRDCLLRLVLEFAEGQEDIPSLKISVENKVFDFENNTVLYESETEIRTASLDVKIYLSNDAPASVGNSNIAFYFAFYAI